MSGNKRRLFWEVNVFLHLQHEHEIRAASKLLFYFPRFAWLVVQRPCVLKGLERVASGPSELEHASRVAPRLPRRVLEDVFVTDSIHTLGAPEFNIIQRTTLN